MDLIKELPDLSEFASAVAAWAAFILSIFSFYYSRQAVRLSEEQDERRKPKLILYQRDAYFRDGWKEGIRVYAFLISISNRSDSDNALADLELRITYRLSQDTAVTVKVLSDATFAAAYAEREGSLLQVSTRIDAHQTVSGWCHFEVKDAVLKDSKGVERYVVAITDSLGTESLIEPIMIREYLVETKAEKMGSITP